MGKTAFIIAGGHIGDPAFLQSRLSRAAPYVLICADSGARHARQLGLTPQAIIGDMDSADDDLLKYFEEKGSIIVRHPKDKDETDTQLALEYALAAGPAEVVIFGALGGRLDHTLANVSLLMAGMKSGVPVKLVDEWCEVFPVKDQAVIEGGEGQTISVFPFAGRASGITLEGFAYPLTDGVMEAGRPYGISNKLAAARGIISVKKGVLLVVRYF